MLLILTVLKSSIFQKKLKIYREICNHSKYYRIQAYDSVMPGYSCVGFIDFKNG